jgi:hypothetical protein
MADVVVILLLGVPIVVILLGVPVAAGGIGWGIPALLLLTLPFVLRVDPWQSPRVKYW